MSMKGKKKCCNCKEFFTVEPRSRKRQKYCKKPECRKASKSSSQKRWMSKTENKMYFQGAEHVQRVRQWRAEHPGYWRKKGGTLQDILPPIVESQAIEKAEENPENGKPKTLSALQDIFWSQPFVMIGLIANLTGITLQDDMASVGSKLLKLGQDIISGESNATEESITAGAITSYSSAVQLGGSASSP